MIRLEQVRGEMLERFERVDRRFAQNEQRLGRIEQRLAELGDRIEALRAELLAQLELLSWETSGVARHDPASDYVFELAPESPDSTEPNELRSRNLATHLLHATALGAAGGYDRSACASWTPSRQVCPCASRSQLKKSVAIRRAASGSQAKPSNCALHGPD